MNSENLQQNVTTNSKLSYNEYKRMTEEKNQKNKVKPLDFKTITAVLLNIKVKIF